MIESMIGRPGSKLRKLFRAVLVLGTTTLSLLACALAFSSTAALAAPGPPEVLTESVPWMGSLEAHVEATVNPNEPITACHIQYGKTTVTEHEVACEPATVEGGEQAVSQTLTGLEAATTYHYRFFLKNGAAEEATGAEEQFETPAAEAPAVISEAAEWTATLETHVVATVNSDNQVTECHIQYGKTTVTEKEVPCEQAKLEGPFGEVGVSDTLTGLKASTKYHYRFVLKNTSAEETKGTEETFETTALETPVIVSESASVAPFQATVNATIDPHNEVTECHIHYGKTTVTEKEAPCEPEMIEGPFAEETGVAATLMGLESGTKYHYEFFIKNTSGEEVTGTDEEFETVAEPSELETGNAEGITDTTAELGGKLNAGGETTYYIEYGTEPCGATTCGTRSGEAGAGGRAQESVAAIKVEGLIPHTTYHYWLVATNGAVTEPIHGEEEEFTTLDAIPLKIEIGSASSITTTSADLGGGLNPGGESTYYFEYGTTPCSSTACGQQSAHAIATGLSQASVTPIKVSGLKPNTVYYYWLVTTNEVTEPLHSVPSQFRTAATQAEVEAEAAVLRRSQEEAAATAAAKAKVEEETRHREEAVAAVTAAQNKQYEEIAAVTASSKRSEEELARTEALIADTSVKITKVRVSSGGVVVTIQVSQAGNIAVTGTGLKKKTLAKITPGTHTVTITLNGAGKTARKHHKKTTITVTLDTSLTSVSASTAVKL
jgi:hypothetical protein